MCLTRVRQHVPFAQELDKLVCWLVPCAVAVRARVGSLLRICIHLAVSKSGCSRVFIAV